MASADRRPPEPGPDAGTEELQADIDQTRSQLGETVGALSDKLDVKTRAQDKATETKEAVVGRAQTATAEAKANPAVPVGVILAGAAVIGFLWWRRRR